MIDSIFLLLLLVMFALQQPETLVLAGVLCALYAFLRWDFVSVDFEKLIYVLLVVLALMMAVFRMNHGLTSIFYLFSTVSAFYAAKRFSASSLMHLRKCLEIVFWVVILGIAYGFVLYREFPEPLGEIIPGSSTNALPSYVIVLQIALSVAVLLEKNRLPVLSAFATFVIAVIGLGRGSIFVALLIIIFSIIANIACDRVVYGRAITRSFSFWIVLLFIPLGITGFLLADDIFGELIVAQKFLAWGLLDPSRSQMLTDYFAKLDMFSLIFGMDYSGTSIDELYLGNPHNSFIRLHSYFGIFGFVLFLFSPLVILISRRLPLYSNIVFILVLLILLRAVSEPILFPTALDFFYFLILFMFWKYAPSMLPARGLKC